MNFLAIDVGGTEIKYAIISDQMELSNKGYVPTPQDTIEHFLDALESIYEPVKDKVLGIAMSLPGFIDTKLGKNNGGGALTYNIGVCIADKVKERLGCTVHLENDAKAAAMAELWKGSLQGVGNAAVFIIGTGVGGGIIVDGKLIRGHTFTAGEFSFINSDIHDESPNSMLCNYCGTPSLIQYYKEFSQSHENMDGRELFRRYYDGDVNADKALDKFTRYIALKIFDLGVILNPEKVAIGGGISAQDILIEKIIEQLKALPINETMFNGADNNPMIPEIVRCKFGNDANLIGAVYSYMVDLL